MAYVWQQLRRAVLDAPHLGLLPQLVLPYVLLPPVGFLIRLCCMVALLQVSFSIVHLTPQPRVAHCLHLILLVGMQTQSVCIQRLLLHDATSSIATQECRNAGFMLHEERVTSSWATEAGFIVAMNIMSAHTANVHLANRCVDI